jgi:hypothetical protein
LIAGKANGGLIQERGRDDVKEKKMGYRYRLGLLRGIASSRRVVLIAGWIFGSAMFGSIDRGAVTIDRKPAVVEHRTFDPAHPPADMPPLKGAEAAVTESKFDCQVAMKYQVLGHQWGADGCVTTLLVQDIHATVQLNVIIWLPNSAGAKLTAHEEGHRRIAEQIYGDAERIARTVGQGLDGKKLVATASDCATADKKATDSSAQQFCEGYLKQTFDVTRQVGDAYDELTAHGTRAEPAEDEAIRQAFQKITGKGRPD